jgi:hypothetical protein
MMIGNWPVSKDDLYGPPPAYSSTRHFERPPSYTPSVYVVPVEDLNYQERDVSHTIVHLSTRLTRYLLGTGLVHMIVGVAAIICDVTLTVMNQSYSFAGLWTGASSIILGIYIIIFISQQDKHICSFERLRLFHCTIGVLSIAALVLASINLASDSCYKSFLGPDDCHQSAHVTKIVLVTIFSLICIQAALTTCLIIAHGNKLYRQGVNRSNRPMSNMTR